MKTTKAVMWNDIENRQLRYIDGSYDVNRYEVVAAGCRTIQIILWREHTYYGEDSIPSIYQTTKLWRVKRAYI